MKNKISSSKKLEQVQRKSLLRKSDVEYADYSLNPVEGCSHGCAFPCYAYLMAKRFGKVKDYGDWIKPKIVSNWLEILDKEIPRLKDKINSVFLSFTTDPFMFKQPEVCELSLKIIERLNLAGIKSIVLTKGLLPRELINKKRYGSTNEYGITLVSLDEKFREKYESGAAPLKERIKSLKYLHDKGLKTWISMEPYPTPSMINQDIEDLLEKIKFVDKIIFGRIHYNAEANRSAKINPDFYAYCIKKITAFCKKNRMKLIVKKGTI